MCGRRRKTTERKNPKQKIFKLGWPASGDGKKMLKLDDGLRFYILYERNERERNESCKTDWRRVHLENQ